MGERDTIKAFVLRRLAEGADVERLAVEAAEHFPHRLANRSYVLRLKRELNRRTVTEGGADGG